MNYRYLGNSGLKISEICFGVMTFTGENGWTHLGTIEQDEATRLTDIAIEKGVNFFDTADVYSNGVSEEMLGVALKGKRPAAVIATKCGFKMTEGPNNDGHSRKRLFEACEASLKRLHTDYIDLFQIHSYDFTTTFEEFLSALNDLVKQGKVRYIGASNFFAWQLMKASAISEKSGWEKFISLQAFYTLLGRDIEYELVPLCVEEGLGIIIWSPLHGGILTGKYKDESKWPQGTRIKDPSQVLPYDREKCRLILNEVENIANARNTSMGRISLSYLLHKPGVKSVIIGARNESQLLDNIGASEIQLSAEEMNTLDQVSVPARIYPYWYFDIFRKERMENYFENLYKRR
jgi:aryl-alcohol dehydrogenase-like predicted oxidoreductase